jgi:hypothetical protein
MKYVIRLALRPGGQRNSVVQLTLLLLPMFRQVTKVTNGNVPKSLRP